MLQRIGITHPVGDLKWSGQPVRKHNKSDGNPDELLEINADGIALIVQWSYQAGQWETKLTKIHSSSLIASNAKEDWIFFSQAHQSNKQKRKELLQTFLSFQAPVPSNKEENMANKPFKVGDNVLVIKGKYAGECKTIARLNLEKQKAWLTTSDLGLAEKEQKIAWKNLILVENILDEIQEKRKEKPETLVEYLNNLTPTDNPKKKAWIAHSVESGFGERGGKYNAGDCIYNPYREQTGTILCCKYMKSGGLDRSFHWMYQIEWTNGQLCSYTEDVLFLDIPQNKDKLVLLQPNDIVEHVFENNKYNLMEVIGVVEEGLIECNCYSVNKNNEIHLSQEKWKGQLLRITSDKIKTQKELTQLKEQFRKQKK